jgi:hypothetical protein
MRSQDHENRVGNFVANGRCASALDDVVDVTHTLGAQICANLKVVLEFSNDEQRKTWEEATCVEAMLSSPRAWQVVATSHRAHNDPGAIPRTRESPDAPLSL